MSEKVSKSQSRFKKKHWWIGSDLSFHSNIMHKNLMAYILSTKTTVMWHWREKRKDTSAILFYILEPWKCNLQVIHFHFQGSNILFQVPYFFSWIAIERSENMKEKKQRERERISSNVNSKNFHSMKRRKAKQLYFLVKKLN